MITSVIIHLDALFHALSAGLVPAHSVVLSLFDFYPLPSLRVD